MVVNELVGNSMEWRCVGPFRGGRVVAVAGHPNENNVFYFGAVAGGVWKTYDGGSYWENVTDGFLDTASIGAIAVSNSDPNIIYVGTGEACIRVDVTHGDGVYKSTDAGASWKHVGLSDTRHISRVRIHPDNPDLVYVAALGHAFGNNNERGIFRSVDGGETWENILFVNDETGAADLCIDPNNPRILYAGMWEGKRSFWEMKSGGEKSGLYRSIDGGDTWDNLTGNSGLPKGLMGRIGVSASGALSGRVWALIESEHGGLFRSDDYGNNWQMVNDNEDVRSRPWYYTHVFADPKDSDTVWVLAAGAWKSTDGGQIFKKMNMPHGDNHDIWIDPDNTQRMIEGNDGGACVSFNGGETWSTIYNQPTSEMYYVATDYQFPYRLYGTQQDNSAVSVPSRSIFGSIPWSECYVVGLSESGKIALKTGDSNIIYSAYPGGTLQRYDHKTGQVRVIMVWPEYSQNSAAAEYKYRFGWEFPIIASKHDPNTLYVSGNVVFKSTDEGATWEPISGDLTYDDKTKQQISGPITSEGPWAEIYCTVYTLAESPITKGVLWAGTDDGLIYVSKNDGKSWDNITPSGLPKFTMVSCIEPSSYNPGVAYVAATGYKNDDNTPFLYKTSNYGKDWELIVTGIPEEDFTRVIREDPSKKGLLYAGTETGVYISLDDGKKWESLKFNLPVVPIYDLKIKDGDLIAATHGRSFWILDDISVLAELAENSVPGFSLFKPREYTRVLEQIGSRIEAEGEGKHYMSIILGEPATYMESANGDGNKYLNAGTNPPDGAIIYYYLDRDVSDEIKLDITDSEDKLLKSFSSNTCDELSGKKGVNRLVWNLRDQEVNELDDAVGGASPFGAQNTGILLPPGNYNLQLTCKDFNSTAVLQVVKDPRTDASTDDLNEQYILQDQIRAKYYETYKNVQKLRSVRKQLNDWLEKARGLKDENKLAGKITRIETDLADIENQLVPFKSAGKQPRGIPVGLYFKLKELMGVVASGDYRPTAPSYELLEDLSTRLEEKFNVLDNIYKKQIKEIVQLIDEMGIPTIKI